MLIVWGKLFFAMVGHLLMVGRVAKRRRHCL